MFFGSMIEADAMPVTSGAVAHLGYFGLAGVMAASVGGMFAGDCVFYWLGRGFGDRIEKTGFYQKHLPKAERFIGKFGVWQILAARVIYGTRNATMVFWGIKKLNFAKFAVIDFLGCLVWGTLLSSLGYFLSLSVKSIVGDIKQFELGLLAVVILAVSLIFTIKFLKNRKIGGKE